MVRSFEHENDAETPTRCQAGRGFKDMQLYEKSGILARCYRIFDIKCTPPFPSMHVEHCARAHTNAYAPAKNAAHGVDPRAITVAQRWTDVVIAPSTHVQ